MADGNQVRLVYARAQEAREALVTLPSGCWLQAADRWLAADGFDLSLSVVRHQIQCHHYHHPYSGRKDLERT